MNLTIKTKRKLTDSGDWLEEKEFYVDGIKVTEQEAHDLVPDGDSSSVGIGFLPKSCNAWPILSDGFAVDPTQVKDAEEHCKKLGVPTQFLPDGRAVFTSQRHQREVLKAHYMINRDDNAGGQSRTVRKPTPNRDDYV